MRISEIFTGLSPLLPPFHGNCISKVLASPHIGEFTFPWGATLVGFDSFFPAFSVDYKNISEPNRFLVIL